MTFVPVKSKPLIYMPSKRHIKKIKYKMEIRRSRWEFDKQIIIDIIKIKGNCIILKMQKYGSMALPRKKNPTITKNKASVRLFKHESQKNTRKFNKHDKKQGIDFTWKDIKYTPHLGIQKMWQMYIKFWVENDYALFFLT